MSCLLDISNTVDEILRDMFYIIAWIQYMTSDLSSLRYSEYSRWHLSFVIDILNAVYGIGSYLLDILKTADVIFSSCLLSNILNYSNAIEVCFIWNR